VADVATTVRELDPQARTLGFDGYDGMREAYPVHRRARCQTAPPGTSNS